MLLLLLWLVCFLVVLGTLLERWCILLDDFGWICAGNDGEFDQWSSWLMMGMDSSGDEIGMDVLKTTETIVLNDGIFGRIIPLLPSTTILNLKLTMGINEMF